MKKIYRLVAYIFPEKNWVGDQLDESQNPRIARVDERFSKNYGVCIQEVGHPRDDPHGWMVYHGDLYLPQSGTVQEWADFRDKVDHALSSPVMHRDDFTLILEH